MKNKDGSGIVTLSNYKKSTVKKERILSIDLFKEEGGKLSYSYKMKKSGEGRVSDQFIAYCMAYIVKDIVEYSEDPCDILDLTQQMIERLGYDNDEQE